MNPILFLLFLFFISCSPRSQHHQMSHVIWIPWLNAAGEYTIQKVSINTIDSWSPLRGSAVKIQSHGSITGEMLSSQEVVMEYTHDRSGVVIPLTQFSTEVASIYAHFERLKERDLLFGVPQSNVTRKVYVRFNTQSAGLTRMTNNALYVLENDSFFIVPYESNKLPISVNGSILAHEHFHSIFARLLLKPLSKEAQLQGKKLLSLVDEGPHETSALRNFVMTGVVQKDEGVAVPKSSDRLEDFFAQSISTISKIIPPNSSKQIKHINLVLLTALNEGLADVWGWLYSQNPCFIAPSLDLDSRGETNPHDKEHYDNRCLSTNVEILPKDVSSLGMMENSEGEMNQIRTKAYRLGTNLARMIYRRLEERGELHDTIALNAWAKHIVETLPKFLPEMMQVYVNEDKSKTIFAWDRAVDQLLFGAGTPSLPEGACEKWSKILFKPESQDFYKNNCPSRIIEMRN